MQAIGNQVILVLLFPFTAIVSIIVYYWSNIRNFFSNQLNPNVRVEQNQEQRQRRQRYDLNDNICSICLAQPKEQPASSTCGHSFCSTCILTLYQRQNEMIKCPLCRKEIHILFKLFDSNEQTSQIQEKLREYNRTFDDNRPILRRIIELPYVLKRLIRKIFSWNFLVFFVRNFFFIRFLFFMVFYILLPFDLLPEKALGLIGFVDDALIIIFVLLIVIGNIAIRFYRGHN